MDPFYDLPPAPLTRKSVCRIICVMAAVLVLYILAVMHYARAQHGERDFGRTCMALAIYGEARGEGSEAMAEVGRLVLRRYEAGTFGATLCDVVAAPDQFAGVSEWFGKDARAHVPPEKEAWEQAQQVADTLIKDRDMYEAALCPGTLFFHSNAGAAGQCRVAGLYFYGGVPTL